TVITAICTVALVIVTGIYAWLTRTIAVKTGESATAAKEAAEASKIAAVAAQRAAAATEASLPIAFEGTGDRMDDGRVWITMHVKGASVWIHSARLLSGPLLATKEGRAARIAPSDLHVPSHTEPKPFPQFVSHGGNGLSLDWPNSPFRLTDWGCAVRI